MTVTESLAELDAARHAYGKACHLITKAQHRIHNADTQRTRGGALRARGALLRLRSGMVPTLDAADKLKQSGDASFAEGIHLRSEGSRAEQDARGVLVDAQRLKARAAERMDKATEALKVALAQGT
jgi:hypothetical protein